MALPGDHIARVERERLHTLLGVLEKQARERVVLEPLSPREPLIGLCNSSTIVSTNGL